MGGDKEETYGLYLLELQFNWGKKKLISFKGKGAHV